MMRRRTEDPERRSRGKEGRIRKGGPTDVTCVISATFPTQHFTLTKETSTILSQSQANLKFSKSATRMRTSSSTV